MMCFNEPAPPLAITRLEVEAAAFAEQMAVLHYKSRFRSGNKLLVALSCEMHDLEKGAFLEFDVIWLIALRTRRVRG